MVELAAVRFGAMALRDTAIIVGPDRCHSLDPPPVFEQCTDAKTYFRQPVRFRQENLGSNGLSIVTIPGGKDHIDTGKRCEIQRARPTPSIGLGPGISTSLKTRLHAIACPMGIGTLVRAPAFIGWGRHSRWLRRVSPCYFWGIDYQENAISFKILPDHPVQWEDVWLGAAFTALLFSLGKHLISVYIGSSK